MGSTAVGDSSLPAAKGEDQEAAPRASPFDKKMLRLTLLDLSIHGSHSCRRVYLHRSI